MLGIVEGPREEGRKEVLMPILHPSLFFDLFIKIGHHYLTMMQKICSYCEKEYEARKGVLYCNETCKTMAQVCRSNISMSKFYSMIENMNGEDFKWFVEVPLGLYNAFYKRSVSMSDFKTSISDITSRCDHSISMEDLLFCSYYNATRSGRNWIHHRTTMNGIVSLGKKQARRYLNAALERSVPFSDQVRQCFLLELEDMDRKSTIPEELKSKMLSKFEECLEKVKNGAPRSISKRMLESIKKEMEPPIVTSSGSIDVEDEEIVIRWGSRKTRNGQPRGNNRSLYIIFKGRDGDTYFHNIPMQNFVSIAKEVCTMEGVRLHEGINRMALLPFILPNGKPFIESMRGLTYSIVKVLVAVGVLSRDKNYVIHVIGVLDRIDEFIARLQEETILHAKEGTFFPVGPSFTMVSP